MDKVSRIVARAMSAIIISISLLLFIGYIIEGSRMGNIFSLNTKTIIEFALIAIGVLGLAIAWKWEKTGGIISLLAFAALMVMYGGAFILPMFIPPLNAILFIGEKLSREEAL